MPLCSDIRLDMNNNLDNKLMPLNSNEHLNMNNNLDIIDIIDINEYIPYDGSKSPNILV